MQDAWEVRDGGHAPTVGAILNQAPTAGASPAPVQPLSQVLRLWTLMICDVELWLPAVSQAVAVML